MHLATAAWAQPPTIAIATLEQAPTIDGEVDPDEWSGAATLDLHLVQLEPEYGQDSPFRTVIHIGQTESALDVAFVAHDPDPPQLAAAVTARDGNLDDDDSVAVMLDTFHPMGRAYRRQRTHGRQVVGRTRPGGARPGATTIAGPWSSRSPSRYYASSRARTVPGGSVSFEPCRGDWRPRCGRRRPITAFGSRISAR